MTDAELRDAAVAELELTTRGLKGFNPPPNSHWGKALALLEQIGAGSVPVEGSGLGYLQLGNGQPPTAHQGDYDRLLVTFRGGADWSGRDLSRVVAYTSPFRLLVGKEWNGMTAEEARANGWLLKNASGGEIGATWPGDDRMADIGLPAYQQAWCQKIEGYFGPRGVTGFYMDDFNRDSWLCDSTPAKYPTTAQWEAAVVSLAKFVSGYFKPKGWYVAANTSGYTPGSPKSSNGDDDVAFYTKVGPFLSACMCEYFQITQNGTIRLSGTSTWQHHWEGWQRLVPLCNSLETDLIAISFGDTPAKRDYCLASFLLDWDGQQGMFISSPGSPTGPTDPWNASFDKMRSLGAPAGEKAKVGNAWRRTYANGWVEVDPVAGTGRIN